MSAVALVTGYAVIFLSILACAAPIARGVVVSTSMHRWHYSRMRINGRRMTAGQWCAFAHSWLSTTAEQMLLIGSSTTISLHANDGTWEGVGKWEVWKIAEDEAQQGGEVSDA